MTAMYAQERTDFSLVCDECGLIVGRLAANLHNWDLAWSFFSRHGWVGERAPEGPHRCPRCLRDCSPVAVAGGGAASR
ncbi:hypothetical protein ACQP00_29580 [Dactylosporangium sp. CS-047395]|uniref:hypothetical protein n=1 Tax=Dactylosporangium sp. CS-047395 TaxID=3239936 RepID=UPI003D8F89A9